MNILSNVNVLRVEKQNQVVVFGHFVFVEVIIDEEAARQVLIACIRIIDS
jgi:hypothetical protein